MTGGNKTAQGIPTVGVIIKELGTERTIAELRSTAWPNLKPGDPFLLWNVAIDGKEYERVACVVHSVSFQYSGKDPVNPLFMVIYLETKETR